MMESDNSIRPVQITWSHGDIMPEKSRIVPCEILTDIRSPNKIRKVVVGDGGAIFCGKLDQSSLANNYIAVRNRKTNTVRWYLTDNFLMLPYRSASQAKETLKKDESVKDAITNLNKEMGSKKSKRQIMDAAKINVSLDKIEDTLKTAVQNNEGVMAIDTTTSTTMSTYSYLPPCDRNATSVDQVYKVYDLLSPEILNSLDELALEVLKKDIMKLAVDERLTPFFFKVYGNVGKLDTSKIKLLLFADTLVQFLKEPMKTIRAKNPVLCKYSTAINAKLLEDFCIIGLGGVRNRPPSMRDKAICYIIVCLFLISNFTIDMSLLSGFITAVDYSKLPIFMRAVGASKDRGSSTTFRLKLPLAELSKSTGTGRKSGGYIKSK